MREILRLPPNRDGGIWYYTSTGQLRPSHRHDEIEVNLVVQGTAHYLIDERRYKLHRNSVIWLFPEQNHLLLDESSDYRMWIVVFKPELLRRLCVTDTTRPLLETAPSGHFCRQLPDQRTRRLESLFADVQEVEGDLLSYNTGLAYSLLSAWSAYLMADLQSSGIGVHPAVERAAHLLRTTTEPLPLETLARACGLSRSRLSRLFKQQIGLSLVDFRNRQRIERFLELYGHGQRMTTLEAALGAGFGSYPQFHRVFKQWMGCTPTAYCRGQQVRIEHHVL